MANSILVDSYGRTSDERETLREQMRRVNADAAANWDNQEWRREMAQELTEVIYRGFDHENLISLMSTVDNVGFDERVFVKEVRGLRAFWVARGGHIESSHMHAEVMELPRDTIGFAVEEFEDKLRTNFAETQATLVDLGIRRMDAAVNERFLSLLQAAVPSSSSSYVSGSGLSLTALNTAMRSVRDASLNFQIAIVGRATMTDQIMDQLLGSDNNGAGFLPESNEAMVQRGVLGTYRGAPIITLKNYLDDTDTSYFPANELYVLSKDATRFAFFGGLLAKEYDEDDNWYWHYRARRDCGGAVIRTDRIRRFIDTSQSA